MQKENALKKLREAKWLKICDDLKAKVIEANVDFSTDDLLNAFLQAKHSTKPKRKAKNFEGVKIGESGNVVGGTGEVAGRERKENFQQPF